MAQYIRLVLEFKRYLKFLLLFKPFILALLLYPFKAWTNFLTSSEVETNKKKYINSNI